MLRATAVRLAAAAGLLAVTVALALMQVPVVSFLAKGLVLAAGIVLVLWLVYRGYQTFMWKVGRRLTFSYFLIGVVPIPMALLLVTLTAFILGGFFLGHLYRDAMAEVQEEMVTRAEDALEAFTTAPKRAPSEEDGFSFDYYRGGSRVGGAGLAPETWPAWLTEEPAGDGAAADPVRFVALANGSPTLALAVEKGKLGVVAVYTDDLAADLRRVSGLWVEIGRPDPGGAEPTDVVLGNRTVTFGPPGAGQHLAASQEERLAYFGAEGDEVSLWDRPLITWVHQSPPLESLADGRTVAPYAATVLNAPPRLLTSHLFSLSSELDALAWIGLAALSLVLSTLYGVAVLVALAMIFGLSRAVNRLSRATASIQEGDFSVRIPVRRRDQLGALQRSFNEMAENLETLVATAAQKEVLERELSIARELQESLLPGDLPQGEAVEFATLFEPSAAIGGDYFDILRLDEHRLAVAIADVSGHGLSSGLRMAMLKAAISILIEDTSGPADLLRRLDALVRGNGGARVFVTATLAIVDLARGRLEITNAGHPPTYLLRRGEVEEILLPSAPLGSLGNDYATREVALETGDVLVWLSDGLIEATDGRGEPFGYDGVLQALSGRAASAVEARSALVAAVEKHAAGHPADDDRTLVVMHYRGAGGEPGASSGPAEEEASPPSPAPADTDRGSGE